MKKTLLIALLCLLQLGVPVYSATYCPTPAEQQKAADLKKLSELQNKYGSSCGITPAQAAKDAQQQAKDAQQGAKDQQQIACDKLQKETASKQSAKDREQAAKDAALKAREIAVTAREAACKDFKCPKPCCNGGSYCGTNSVHNVQTTVGEKPKEPACPPKPTDCYDFAANQEYIKKYQAWQKEREIWLVRLGEYYDAKTKARCSTQPPVVTPPSTNIVKSVPLPVPPIPAPPKDDKEHTNHSGQADGTNPGGQTHNQNGFDNPSNSKK